jgi:predicted RNA-binding protein associated with RNAse of E/G family
MSPGDAYAICHFWEGDERSFAGWYVNMQEPLRRDGRSYLTQDLELDIWIGPDGAWRWKDEQELEDWVPRGRFTREEVTEVRRVGEDVLARWPFPTGWEDWMPDPSWTVPGLPDA